jgi:hypothetical protein
MDISHKRKLANLRSRSNIRRDLPRKSKPFFVGRRGCRGGCGKGCRGCEGGYARDRRGEIAEGSKLLWCVLPELELLVYALCKFRVEEVRLGLYVRRELWCISSVKLIEKRCLGEGTKTLVCLPLAAALRSPSPAILS